MDAATAKGLKPQNRLPNIRRIRRILLAALGLAVVWIGTVKAKELLFFRSNTETVIAQESEIEHKVSSPSVVIRDELPLVAPAGGLLKKIVAEGERVRAGTTWGYILPVPGAGERLLSYKLVTPRTGVICYHPDGLEKLLMPETIDELDWAAVMRLADTHRPYQADQRVAHGQIIAKMVNNLSAPLLLAAIPPEGSQQQPAPGTTLLVGLGEEGRFLQAEVLKARFGAEQSLLLLRLPPGAITPHERKVNITLVLEKYKSIVLPVTALAFREGKAGVVIVTSRGPTWQPVEVKMRYKDGVVIEGIPPGTPVWKKPIN